MNSASDTDYTTDSTRIIYCRDRYDPDIKKSESWHEKEKNRLSNILEYNLDNWDIDDKGLQAITKLSAIICGMPLSFITLVGEKYVKFLSRFGCELLGTIRQDSFCDLAIEQNEYFEIEDALRDPRFDENELVKGCKASLRFYGAYPLISPKGYHFGSLCVCDFKEGKLDEIKIRGLKTLTDEVMVHLELRRHNKELQEANERADKLAKVKDDFMNNVSHELRTPLNAIGGYAEILLKTELDTDQNEAVSIIKGSSEILVTLINDILDFSKIQLGKLQLENIPFDLRKTIKNVKDLLNPKAKEKNLKFELKVDENVPKFIMGDKIRMNQIIMNLTGNALKFTKEGSVKIDVKILEETENNIKLHFSVKDTGIGIQEDKLHTIFERFEQAGKDITRKFGGTGLGLNISKNLVELHNSTLELKSIYGEGTEFFFSIMFNKFIDQGIINNNNRNENNYIEKISNIKELKLLVCEDNVVNIKLIKAIFKNKDINIEIAENGKIAIDLLKKKKKFDLILMDLQMPEMNGYEATKYIRNVMNLNIPIIGFSASISEVEKNYCFEIGMNDYILKSFGGNEIFEKLDKFVSANKLYQEDVDKNDDQKDGSSFNNSKQNNSKDTSNKKNNKAIKKTKKYKNNFPFLNKNIPDKFNKSFEFAKLKGKKKFIYKKKGFNNINLKKPLSYSDNLILIDKNNISINNSNDPIQRINFSQDDPKVKKVNDINFSSEVNINNTSKNSSKLNNINNKSNSNKNNSEENKDYEIGYFSRNYFSCTECDLKKRKLNLDISLTNICNKNNNKKDSSDKNKVYSIELDLNYSFKSENNAETYISYINKCISLGLDNPSNKNKKIGNYKYKYSKFNEKKFSSFNNSVCLNDKNNSNNGSEIYIADDINNKNISNSEKQPKSEYIMGKNNNQEFKSNRSNNSKIIENLKNSIEEKSKKTEEYKNQTFNEEKKFCSPNGSLGKLKENDSLDFSQVSIRFENFDDISEREHDDYNDLEDINEEIKENMIEMFEDDPEMRAELMELFLEENPKQMKSLKSAIMGRNLESIKFVAHTMKPSVLMFGMRKSYKMLAKIEYICKSISLSKLKYLYEDIKKEIKIFYSENKVIKN
jgi:signal transduction histidine kinase/DNA-binding response OmpR family regulator